MVGDPHRCVGAIEVLFEHLHGYAAGFIAATIPPPTHWI
jgi:hypothetical protein